MSSIFTTPASTQSLKERQAAKAKNLVPLPESLKFMPKCGSRRRQMTAWRQQMTPGRRQMAAGGRVIALNLVSGASDFCAIVQIAQRESRAVRKLNRRARLGLRHAGRGFRIRTGKYFLCGRVMIFLPQRHKGHRERQVLALAQARTGWGHSATAKKGGVRKICVFYP